MSHWLTCHPVTRLTVAHGWDRGKCAAFTSIVLTECFIMVIIKPPDPPKNCSLYPFYPQFIHHCCSSSLITCGTPLPRVISLRYYVYTTLPSSEKKSDVAGDGKAMAELCFLLFAIVPGKNKRRVFSRCETRCSCEIWHFAFFEKQVLKKEAFQSKLMFVYVSLPEFFLFVLIIFKKIKKIFNNYL